MLLVSARNRMEMIKLMAPSERIHVGKIMSKFKHRLSTLRAIELHEFYKLYTRPLPSFRHHSFTRTFFILSTRFIHSKKISVLIALCSFVIRSNVTSIRLCFRLSDILNTHCPTYRHRLPPGETQNLDEYLHEDACLVTAIRHLQVKCVRLAHNVLHFY